MVLVAIPMVAIGIRSHGGKGGWFGECYAVLGRSSVRNRIADLVEQAGPHRLLPITTDRLPDASHEPGDTLQRQDDGMPWSNTLEFAKKRSELLITGVV